MPSVERKLLVYLAHGRPQLAAEINVIIERVEHSADRALGEHVHVACAEHIRGIVRLNQHRKLVVTAVPGSVDVLYPAAELALEHLQCRSDRLSLCRVQIP